VAHGLEQVLWCDLRVAASNAVFGVSCRRFVGGLKLGARAIYSIPAARFCVIHLLPDFYSGATGLSGRFKGFSLRRLQPSQPLPEYPSENGRQTCAVVSICGHLYCLRLRGIGMIDTRQSAQADT
jgi:hypothetical protein